MAQCKLSSYYTTRKRKTDTKLLKDTDNDLKINSYQESIPNVVKLIEAQEIKAPSQQPILLRKSKVTSESSNIPTQVPEISKANLKSKSKIPRVKQTRSKAKKQTKATYDAKNADIRKSFLVDNSFSETSEVDSKDAEKVKIDSVTVKAKTGNRAAEKAKVENNVDEVKVDIDAAKKSEVDIHVAKETKVDIDVAKKTKVDIDVAKKTKVDIEVAKKTKVYIDVAKKTKVDVAKKTKVDSNVSKKAKVDKVAEKVKITNKVAEKVKVSHKVAEKAEVTNKVAEKAKVSHKVAEKAEVTNKVAEKAEVPHKVSEKAKVPHKVAEVANKVDEKVNRIAEKAIVDNSITEKAKVNNTVEVEYENETFLNSTYTIISETPQKSEEVLVRTPKRNLSNPDEANADSKKKKRQDLSHQVNSTLTDNEAIATPNKHSELIMKHSARKNLFSDYRSDSLGKKNSKDLEQLATVSVNHKVPIISSEKLSELKERLARFDKTYQKFQDFKSNKCKITSVISADVNKKPDVAETEEKPVPCYVKHHSLVSPSATLVLPYNFKLLSESFRCSDTVVSMLNNRKEDCTFDKLKNGIQDMTKRNFSKMNLGQIKTVFPHAYNYHIEKNSVSVMNRKPGTLPYELVISPNLTMCKPEIKEGTTPKPYSGTFKPITAACLIERKNIFISNLVNIVKRHHQNFLAKLNPPVFVPMDKITKWHPKFPVNSLPEIEASDLPEPPNKVKVNTAMDVLNKIRGSAGKRIEKALQSVVDKNLEQEKKKNVPENKNKSTMASRLLKNVSADILERVRARESARIVEDITKDPKDKKRKEMMERIPELIRILRTYFITERRAAISLEDATQKIMDSYHSTLNAEDIRQHLQLIANICPKWLSLIPIRKGLFLKIDKNKDINVLLDNIPA